MRYLMKQKLWGFGDDFAIQDANGTDVFFVDGKAMSIGDKLSFQDMQGKELAFISQKILSLMKTYHIYRDGNLFAEITKKLSLFKDKFEVDVPGPNDYTVTGNASPTRDGSSSAASTSSTVKTISPSSPPPSSSTSSATRRTDQRRQSDWLTLVTDQYSAHRVEHRFLRAGPDPTPIVQVIVLLFPVFFGG